MSAVQDSAKPYYFVPLTVSQGEETVIADRYDRYGFHDFTRYYRELGRLMGIKEIPETYAAFERLLDDYEARFEREMSLLIAKGFCGYFLMVADYCRASRANGVMVGHLDVRAVDPGVPSSLSRPVVTGLLREKLGFRGLVVTDALDMAAVRRHLDQLLRELR